jgi:hypothetical protein
MGTGSNVSRRRLLFLAVGLASGASIGCKKKPPAACTDTTGLAPDEVQARMDLGYRDATPFPDKTCESCQQYVAATRDGACGTCKILKGPAHPYGYCKSFAPKG